MIKLCFVTIQQNIRLIKLCLNIVQQNRRLVLLRGKVFQQNIGRFAKAATSRRSWNITVASLGNKRHSFDHSLANETQTQTATDLQ